MNLRGPGFLILAIAAAALIFLPGQGLMVPAGWFGEPRFTRVIAMAAVIFCMVYFGTLKFWELLTGDRLEKPLPAILALFLAIRLTVDCARMLMWW
jgi:uncharacterized membrane protein